MNDPRHKKDLKTKSEIFQYLEIGKDVLEKELEKETGSKPREKCGEMIINPREEKDQGERWLQRYLSGLTASILDPLWFSINTAASKRDYLKTYP